MSIEVATVIWGLTLTFIFVAMGFEFDQRATVITILCFAVLGLLGVLMSMKWHIPLLTYIFNLTGIQFWKMNKAMMIGCSLIHLAILVSMIIYCHFNFRWTVVQGSISRKKFLGNVIEYPLDQEHRCRLHYTNHLARVILLNGGDLLLKVGEHGEEELIIYRVFWHIAALDEKIQPFQTTVTTR